MSGISNSKRNPSSLEIADGLYGSAFNSSSREDVGSAMNDWIELSEAEREFALGQLLYLNLQVQTENGRLLRRAVKELEELNDGVQEVVDDYFSADDDPADDDPADDDSADDDAADDDTADDSSGRGEATDTKPLLDDREADTRTLNSAPMDHPLAVGEPAGADSRLSLEVRSGDATGLEAIAPSARDSITSAAQDRHPADSGRNA